MLGLGASDPMSVGQLIGEGVRQNMGDGTMAKTKASPCDVTEFLKDEETIACSLDNPFETGDPACIVKVLGAVAQWRGRAT